MLKDRERLFFEEIRKWEKELAYDQRSDFHRTYDYWVEKGFERIPSNIRKKLFHQLDHFLFYGHSFIQNSNWQSESRNRLISSARILKPSIDTIQDLQELPIEQLRYLADMQMSKHRLASLTQGAITGTGGMLLIGMDIPLQLVINLRAIQMIAMSYGNEVNTPFEMMLSLKVFHASLLPSYLTHREWNKLKEEISEHSDNPYFYNGDERLSSEQTLKTITNQIAKLLLIQAVKRKTLQSIPFLGIGVGARMNYQLTKRSTTFAQRFYEYRALQNKYREDENVG
ncbi:EcsC family protein [Bacillus kexueae]|uniref:EcsC family protein n=1 Tax=Aeribacillus kexueae TaxID=2078952 RepID=UPI001FB04A3C|nr:EcsC family protein [Bacillus kexueae]